MTSMSLWVNTASGTTSDLIGILSLTLYINDHSSAQNFIICKKLKHLLIVGLDFAQRYKIGLERDAYGALFLIFEGKKIATAMEKGSPHQQLVALLKTPVADKWARDERKYLVY